MTLASIPSGPPHRAHNNTTLMQYKTKTHKIHASAAKVHVISL